MLKYLKDRIQGKTPKGGKRSHRWPNTRRAHLEKYPACAACGGTKKLEVHHIIPFHEDPSQEEKEENLVTLCEGKKWMNCHLIFGHLRNYKRKNVHVVEDAKKYRGRLVVAEQEELA